MGNCILLTAHQWQIIQKMLRVVYYAGEIKKLLKKLKLFKYDGNREYIKMWNTTL